MQTTAEIVKIALKEKKEKKNTPKTRLSTPLEHPAVFPNEYIWM
jgi:hypothetical protein